MAYFIIMGLLGPFDCKTHVWNTLCLITHGKI